MVFVFQDMIRVSQTLIIAAYLCGIKSLYAILLLFSLMSGYAGKVRVLAAYLLDKPGFIVANCINKDEPEKGCLGRCHLASELNKSETGTPATANLIATYELPEIILEEVHQSTLPFLAMLCLLPGPPETILQSGFTASVFRPPCIA